MAIDTESRDRLVDVLGEYPARLHELISSADDDALTRAGPEGSWGVVEVLCHLRDWEWIFGKRIARMIEEDDPSFETIDDSLWPIDRDYHAQNPSTVLEDFAEIRSDLVDALESLRISQWEQTGHLPRQGRVTVGWYAEHIANHDREHLQQIRRALRVEDVPEDEDRQADNDDLG